MTGRPEPFVSFSANHEDVLLHRIFGGTAEGVFVDVGAADPRMENDCKALYDRGWSGINIEPNPSLLQRLLDERPRDQSFGCALSDSDGQQTYFEVQGTGLSTLDAVEAQRCRDNGWTVVEHMTAVRTLRVVLEEAGIVRVDFLKVDVEGWEERVLRGNDWSRIRPSVVMVEATLPERPERRETGIEAFLAAQGYRRAHFDGLNDFYVREDFRGADNAFNLPPNVFDNYTSYRLRELEEHARLLAESLEEAKRYSRSDHAALQQKQRDLEDAQKLLFDEQEANKTSRADAEEQIALLRHRLLDSESDCERLRNSVLLLERRNAAFSERIAATHQEREELRLLQEHVESLRRANHALECRLADIGMLAEHRRLQEAELANWIAAIRRSTSWRISLPMRVGGRAVHRIVRRIATRN
ncbi:FkbM family methyltransferase [Acetobacteraceae bacterium KSS8]|uniref:FkbM family methyltransferase n=1 Tax=Endosaccharibacter trunci TaxID=2812733 RepID=A0ABT1W830_9PROT|nr:FkbM family methyltransferase [Acetobacteraceae bacterium KSS8]